MATAIADTPEELQCPVCFEAFNNPKLLDCKHVFCCKCLLQLVGEDQKLVCPVCRAVKRLGSDEKIEDFPEPLYSTKLNETVIRLIAASRAVRGDRTCDTASCGESKEAGYFCKSCVKNMCQICEQKHASKKNTRSHESIRLSKHTVCPEHKGELKTAYCQDCHMSLCKLCFDVEHKTHNVTETRDVVRVKSERLQLFKKSTERNRAYILQQDSNLKTESRNIQDKHSSVEKELQDFRRKVNQLIDDAEGGLQRHLQSETEKLLLHKRKVEDAMTTHECVLTYIGEILHQGGDLDIISAADDIPSLSTNVPLVLPKMDTPSLRGDDVIELCQSLVHYGKSEIMEKPVGDESGPNSPPPNLQPFTGGSVCTKLWESNIDCESYDILYDEKTCAIWIGIASESGGLWRYNLQGRVVSKLLRGFPVHHFSLDTKRDTFIARVDAHSIASISKLGHIIKEMYITGSLGLTGVVYIPDKDWYAVTDRGNHCMWFVDAGIMQVVGKIGSMGPGDDQFGYPWHVFYHFGTGHNVPVIVVGDMCNHCVKVLHTDGKFIRRYGPVGSANRDLKAPTGICVDNKGRLIVCDLTNQRVVRYWHVADEEHWDVLINTEQLGGLKPWGVCVTNRGHLAVTTNGTNDSGIHNKLMLFKYS